jgi:hypothetical protein
MEELLKLPGVAAKRPTWCGDGARIPAGVVVDTRFAYRGRFTFQKKDTRKD